MIKPSKEFVKTVNDLANKIKISDKYFLENIPKTKWNKNNWRKT